MIDHKARTHRREIAALKQELAEAYESLCDEMRHSADLADENQEMRQALYEVGAEPDTYEEPEADEHSIRAAEPLSDEPDPLTECPTCSCHYPTIIGRRCPACGQYHTWQS